MMNPDPSRLDPTPGRRAPMLARRVLMPASIMTCRPGRQDIDPRGVTVWRDEPNLRIFRPYDPPRALVIAKAIC